MKRSAPGRSIFAVIVSLLVVVDAGAAELNDVVTTHEAEVQIDRERFQQIDFDGASYYLKASRPGSHLAEVLCVAPPEVGKKSNAVQLRPARRPAVFAKRLAEGCAPKQGIRPNHFTFEESPAAAPTMGPTPMPKPFKTHAYPSDVDPHVIPEPVDPASEFTHGKF